MKTAALVVHPRKRPHNVRDEIAPTEMCELSEAVVEAEVPVVVLQHAERSLERIRECTLPVVTCESTFDPVLGQCFRNDALVQALRERAIDHVILLGFACSDTLDSLVEALYPTVRLTIPYTMMRNMSPMAVTCMESLADVQLLPESSIAEALLRQQQLLHAARAFALAWVGGEMARESARFAAEFVADCADGECVIRMSHAEFIAWSASKGPGAACEIYEADASLSGAVVRGQVWSREHTYAFESIWSSQRGEPRLRFLHLRRTGHLRELEQTVWSSRGRGHRGSWNYDSRRPSKEQTRDALIRLLYGELARV
jgi:hypothetical protein